MSDRKLVMVPVYLEESAVEALASQIEGESGMKEVTVNVPSEGVEKLKRILRSGEFNADI